jgi:hypothetical protein
MSLTPDEAVRLTHGDVLHDDEHRRWRVNGKPKIWATGKFSIPVKFGLYYNYGYVTDHNLDRFHRESGCPYTGRAHFMKIQDSEERGWARREEELTKKALRPFR